MQSDPSPGLPDSAGLLDSDEPDAVAAVNRSGASPFLLIGDHAGNRVPRRLAGLGIAAADLSRHIGWDIGIGDLGQALARRLDAVFVHQIYSRLVVDCNRAADAPDAVPEVSDGTPIPGNRGLGPAARDRRIAAIHAPYQAAIAAEIARRKAAGQPTVLVALHSFTPALAGATLRPWQVGILHDGAADAFAHALLDILRRRPELTVGDNEPYRMDGIDHTVPRHAFAARLPYAEIEVRQDLLATPAGIAAWTDRLAADLPAALAAI